MTTATDYRTIDVDDVRILSTEQLEEGTTNDNPNHVLEILLPNGDRGFVAGPHGVDCCAIGDWLYAKNHLAATRSDAIGS